MMSFLSNQKPPLNKLWRIWKSKCRAVEKQQKQLCSCILPALLHRGFVKAYVVELTDKVSSSDKEKSSQGNFKSSREKGTSTPQCHSTCHFSKHCPMCKGHR